MFVIALVFLALGWSTKRRACRPSARARRSAGRQLAEPAGLLRAVLLRHRAAVRRRVLSQGRFPYKSSWIEKDGDGKPQARYDGKPAVRYMEYPVLTGVYQYVAMALAKTYTTISKLLALPVVAEVVVFFDVSALGSASPGWGRRGRPGLAGRRVWDAALVGASPLVIFRGTPISTRWRRLWRSVGCWRGRGAVLRLPGC